MFNFEDFSCNKYENVDIEVNEVLYANENEFKNNNVKRVKRKRNRKNNKDSNCQNNVDLSKDDEYKVYKKTNVEVKKVIEVNNDLFDMPEDYSLAHCVSSDLRLGKGIALEFKRRYNNIETLKSQNRKLK